MFGRTADGLFARFGLLRGARLLWQLRLSKLLPRGRHVRVDIPWLRAPIRIRARTSDALVVKELLFTGNFDFPLPPEARFIIDAGANIGLVTAYLATRFPRAKIVALEIDAANFAMLRENVGPYPNVTPVHAGLWSHGTRLEIANPGASSFAFRARQSSAPASVPGYSVADLLAQFGESKVDILKVDIEGGEKEVFGPAADAWIDRVDVVAVELHDRFVAGCEAVVAGRLAGRFRRADSGELAVFARALPGVAG